MRKMKTFDNFIRLKISSYFQMNIKIWRTNINNKLIGYSTTEIGWSNVVFVRGWLEFACGYY